MSDALQQARHHFSQGIEAVEAGRLAEAEQQFAQALHFAPDRPSILTNLGVVRVRLGRCAEALPLLERAAGQETDNLEAWVHLGMARAALGQLAGALGAFDHALAQRADIAQAWVHRGSALRELGRHPEAAASFERAIALGADDDLVRYYLASVRSGESPAAPPRAYVQDLFDGYADGFETHLQSLDYQAHRQLVQGLLARCAPPWQGVLDLGCGTGWVGRELRRAAPGPSCGTVTGIDLSSRMLAQARALGGYDELLQADIGEWLAQAPGAGARWQIAFAADVFIYVGAIDAVLRDLRACLRPGGWLAFSVEALADADGDFRVRPSLRYAHSEAYIRRLAGAHGWQVQAIEHGSIRNDQREPVAGMYAFLQSAGTP
jgi:predicted TPR repeat methyltransferase